MTAIKKSKLSKKEMEKHKDHLPTFEQLVALITATHIYHKPPREMKIPGYNIIGWYIYHYQDGEPEAVLLHYVDGRVIVRGFNFNSKSEWRRPFEEMKGWFCKIKIEEDK